MSELADQHQTLIFVVRLWREANDRGCGHWRGRVEHIGTKEVRYVDDVAAIAGVMECWTSEPDATKGQHKWKKEEDMNPVRNTRWGQLLCAIAVLSLVLATAPVVFANTRYDDGDVPFYARIERGEILHTEEWAFVVFYRPPECVRADFNLLNFFDIPAAFACQPPTTDGFVIIADSADTPLQSKLHGLGAVPVWFVRWPELSAAIADDVLTITELGGLPSLMTGSASFYTETLHPYGGAQVSKLTLVGAGTLEDGRSFRIQANMQERTVTVVHIEFG